MLQTLAVGIPQTEDARRRLRTMLIIMPELNKSISGAILSNETIRQPVPFIGTQRGGNRGGAAAWVFAALFEQGVMLEAWNFASGRFAASAVERRLRL